MKQKVITIALLAALGTLAVSCQKENINELSPVTLQAETAYTVTYYVDGERFQSRMNNDEELTLLLNRLAALARGGHRVAVYKGDTASQSITKEKITFRTRDENKAAIWAEQMIQDGYNVEIYFDEGTGEYVCIATK
jgi:hypothetical protein